MLVQRILQFLKELMQHGELSHSDTQLYKALSDRFSETNPQKKLDSEDILFVSNCFLSRWQAVIDDNKYDYTLNPIGINLIWISFAKELAPQIGKGYLNILIPTVTNTVDYNNLTQLSETVNLENLYVGLDNITIYRKRGLCDHLIKENFRLSTCRNLHTKTLSALSVVELSRLQSCVQPKGDFFIGSDHFISFWDFLKKKAFIRLQADGTLSERILSDLQRLIEKYHIYKKENTNFKFFKQEYQSFLNRLSHNELDNINFFYGVRLTYNGKEHYMLDLLVTIYQAETYNFEPQILGLNEWLKTVMVGLPPAAACTKLSRLSSEPVVLLTENAPNDELNGCWRFVLSLLTSPFTLLPLTGVAISCWDKTNMVFSQAAALYSRLCPFIEANKPAEMLLEYQRIIKEIPVNEGLGFFARMTRFSFTDNWYTNVKNGTLSNMGVYWFEPELLLQGLMQIKPNDLINNSHLNNFLDELIHTYAQKSNMMLKALRINILFSEYLNLLKTEDKIHLIQLINSFDLRKGKENFINNCVTYLGKRLFDLECKWRDNLSNKLSFFNEANGSRYVFSPNGTEQVSEIIETLKDIINRRQCDIEINLKQTMIDYLIGLHRPILTEKVLVEIERSSNPLDYLNAT